MTYGELDKDSRIIASRLQEFGLVPQKDLIGIISKNCYEQDAIMLGAYRRNIANICLYKNHENLLQILKETQVRILFLDTKPQLDRVLQMHEIYVEKIVLIGNFIVDIDAVQKSTIQVISWKTFMTVEVADFEEISPKTESLATISFSSGASGMPKASLILGYQL